MTEDKSVTALIFFYLIIIIIFDKTVLIKLSKLLILLTELLLLFHCPCLEAFVYFKYKTPFQQISPGSQNVLQKWAR